MFSLALFCLLASASAFSTTSTTARSNRAVTTMMAERSKSLPFMLKPAKLDGSMAGDEGFDPLGLSNIDDVGIDLYWMREAELKHCRLAMLAIVGSLAQEIGFVLPGMPTTKNQVAAFWEFFDRNPGPIFASFLFIGIIEVFSGYAIRAGRQSGDRAPGEFGFNPLKFGKTPESAKDLALKEVRNGRLAMWAAAGMLLQGTVTSDGALGNLF